MAKFVLSHDAQDIDDTIDEVVAARGSEASLSARLADIVSDFETDQQRQETEIGVVANAGAKNILRFTARTETVGGVTFTVNADGSVTLDGTKTNNDWFYLSVGNELKKDTYIISSGLPAQDNYNVRLLVTTQDSLSSAIMVCEQERQTRQYTLTRDYSGLYYAIRVGSGTTVDNLTIKPMLRYASITDSTFAPYAPTNRELYEMILALQSGRSVQSAASLMQAGRLDAEQAAADPEEEADA